MALASVCLASLAVQAHAHQGHGIDSTSHWHVTDSVGLLVLAVAVGLGVWFTRGGK
jgi:hypothetical protein